MDALHVDGSGNVGSGYLAFDNLRIYSTATEPVPEVPEVSGDPHFKTWNGKWYDFMGGCDLVLIHAPHFLNSSALEINVRAKVRSEYSYIETAVVKLGEETFEAGSFGDYALNYVSGAEMPASISGFPITHTQLSKKTHVFEIHVTSEEKIVIKTFKDMVSVKIDSADRMRFHGSLGMMGDFETGAMLARDGITVIEDPNAFGAEWQVRSDEPLLFQTKEYPQHPEKCVMPDPAKKSERRLGEGISREAAEAACAKWRSEETKDACIYDVIATGDLDLAEAGAF